MAEQLKFHYIVWEEVFSNGAKIINQTLVEVWKGRHDGSWNQTMANVTKAGYKTILAAPWYLNDIGVDIGIDWDKAYIVDPTDFNGTDAQKDLIVGGSAAMWGIFVDGTNILQRTWPRASAVGGYRFLKHFDKFLTNFYQF